MNDFFLLYQATVQIFHFDHCNLSAFQYEQSYKRKLDVYSKLHEITQDMSSGPFSRSCFTKRTLVTVYAIFHSQDMTQSLQSLYLIEVVMLSLYILCKLLCFSSTTIFHFPFSHVGPIILSNFVLNLFNSSIAHQLRIYISMSHAITGLIHILFNLNLIGLHMNPRSIRFVQGEDCSVPNFYSFKLFIS